MRWSYKTVHYELKKEGLLGSAFLDESEVELSLNEFGKAGWELVSIIETQDGLIAIFKQPLGLPREADFYPPEHDGKPVSLQGETSPLQREGSVDKRTQEAGGVEPAVAIDEYEIVADEVIAEDEEAPGEDDDIGSIRIE